jgi:putative proteasome-type protease
MFDVAMLVADAMRDIERRDGEYLQENEIGFNASFIVGGQIAGEPLRPVPDLCRGQFHRSRAPTHRTSRLARPSTASRSSTA